MGTDGCRFDRMHAAENSHVEDVPSISAGKVATMLGGDVVGEVGAWKLLVPMMFL